MKILIASLSKTSVTIFALFSITACSTYPSKFQCSDTRGLGCTMMCDIDRQIDSGQIEEVYKKSKCSGKKCKKNSSIFSGEWMQTVPAHRAKMHYEGRGMAIDDLNNIYF